MFPPLALGTVMAVLDISVVGLVLPVLARDLGAPLTTLAWVVLAYVLAITGLLLLFGRLADRVGRRRVYSVGLVVFMAASALCAAAPGVGWLIAARALQGVGAAMMSANSAALLVAAFPPAERGRALGAFGAAVGAGLAFGPPLGGWLVSTLSWHWLFLINLPIGTLALILLRARVPADARGGQPAGNGARPVGASSAPIRAAKAPFSVPVALSALAWSSGLMLVTLALSLAASRGTADRWVSRTAFAGALAFAAFAWAERRATNPLLPWAELRGPLGGALWLTLLGQAISMAAAFLLPLQLEEVAGLDPAHAGRWLALPPVAALVCAQLAGRWADRFGTRPLAVIGLLIAAAGAGVLANLGVTNRGLPAGLLLFGAGLGLFTAPNASAVMGAVGPARLGAAAGLQATARNLGIAGGAAAASAAVALLYAGITDAPLLGPHSSGDGHPADLARSIGLVFAGLAALAAGGAMWAGLAPVAKSGAHSGT
ncbi:MAG: MFS transporter [Candidatus Eisenbacteria bacterium]